MALPVAALIVTTTMSMSQNVKISSVNRFSNESLVSKLSLQRLLMARKSGYIPKVADVPTQGALRNTASVTSMGFSAAIGVSAPSVTIGTHAFIPATE